MSASENITTQNIITGQDPARAARLKKRYASERRFKTFGAFAVLVGILFLALLFISIFSKGYTAFQQTSIQLTVLLDEKVIDKKGTRKIKDLGKAIRYSKLVNRALYQKFDIPLKGRDSKKDRSLAKKIISGEAGVQLRDMVLNDHGLIGQSVTVWLLASGNADSFIKGQISRDTPEARRQIKDKQVAWLDMMREEGTLEKQFNTGLFTFGASSRPESSGIGAAAVGSLYMMLIVLALALPIGVAASIYLEEFAPTNRWTDIIEVNINNLAAVPSIVFGLLGLAVFINFAGLPRSASIVGGLVLTLMTLPTIIIATRSALKAVPQSIRQAALAVGASKTQSIFHHVLPLATPGILTGTIIGLAKALGETAPLLMIGMVAFVKEIPLSPMEPATALPVQIYMWSGAAERAFVERTSAAIIVLLAFLVIMNMSAVILRRRFERRW
ncbi:MAG: phosphate ABC transporter permease PstA [Cohaesibacteraceae bacterium]|nr:phosphate ABC transporter permease PstA [Cohaesibacteraceae bacterium]MBL4876658.1 phosphate ABC transporter permease PstA [Cohaesibacteraceae bacterium]